jgi:omega-amidase
LKRLILSIIQPGPDGVAEYLGEAEGDLVVLPENWLSTKPVPIGEYRREVLRLASRLGSHLLAGIQYVEVNGGVYSIGLLASPQGSLWVVCEKLFPSASVGERLHLRPGVLRGPVDPGLGVKIACVACVDIFYPEIARYHSLRGALVIINPASIAWNRVLLWRSVLASRAAENVVFAAGANKTGTPYPDGRLTGGYSAVYAPDGELLEGLGPHPGVLKASIDPAISEAVRTRRRFIEDVARLEDEGFYNWARLRNVDGHRVNSPNESSPHHSGP